MVITKSAWPQADVPQAAKPCHRFDRPRGTDRQCAGRAVHLDEAVTGRPFEQDVPRQNLARRKTQPTVFATQVRVDKLRPPFDTHVRAKFRESQIAVDCHPRQPTAAEVSDRQGLTGCKTDRPARQRAARHREGVVDLGRGHDRQRTSAQERKRVGCRQAVDGIVSAVVYYRG